MLAHDGSSRRRGKVQRCARSALTWIKSPTWKLSHGKASLEPGHPEIDEAKSTKTREEVRKELDEYIRSGQRDRDRGETQVGG